MNQTGGTARENKQTVNEQQGRLKERGIVFKKSRNHRDGKQAFSLTGMQWLLQKISKNAKHVLNNR